MGASRCGELLVSSSTFAVIQRIHKSVPPQKHPHWKNTNTQLQYSLYCYSWDWWWQVYEESTVNTRSSHSKCSRSPSSLVSAQLQLLPWLELKVHTLGALKKYSLTTWNACDTCKDGSTWNTWNDSATQGANTWELGNTWKDKKTCDTCTWKDTAKKLCNTRTFINTSLNVIHQLAPLHLLA